jgi:hypothetical protein
MAEAAYAAGPVLLGGPPSLSSILFRIFCFLLQRGAHANSALVRGPQRAQVPQNFKSEAPKSGAPTCFFSMFQCFSAGPKQSASAGPQRAQVHQNLKSEASKIGAPNVFPLFQCFSAGPKQCGGPKSQEKCQTSKFKNLDTKERRPKPVFLFPVSARDPNSAGPQRVQGPQRAQVPQNLKSDTPKSGVPNVFFPVSARG